MITGRYDLKLILLSGLGVLFPSRHLLLRSLITDRICKSTGTLKQNATGTDYRTLPPCFD